jgi:hypothetical protein
VLKLNASSGAKEGTLADYNSFPASPGDSPSGLSEYDAGNLMTPIETTSGRRMEIVSKTGSNAASRPLFTSGTTALSTSLRGVVKLIDGNFLLNRTSAFEKLTSNGARIGAPFIPGVMAGSCGTANASFNNAVSVNNGNIIFSNGTTGGNRVQMVSAIGYVSAANCLGAGVTMPAAGSIPVATVYVNATNQLIVAYAGTTLATDINSIYVYDVNETTGAFTGATKMYDASLYGSTYSYLLYGISALGYDSVDKSLFVATALTTSTTVSNYVIEKLTFDPTAKTLTRVGTQPFYNYGFDTKCISGLMVGN